MKSTVTFMLAIACGLLVNTAQATQIFEFTGVSDGGQWNGAVDASSNSGSYTFTGTGGIQELNDRLSMFVNDDTPDNTINPIQSISQVLDLADVVQSFTVDSLDWRAGAGNGGATASLIGYSGGAGGTEQWRINGPHNLSPPITFNAPSTGSFGNAIDTIVWDIPDYLDGVFQHEFDNLIISIVPEPTSLCLLGLASVAAISTRRRR